MNKTFGTIAAVLFATNAMAAGAAKAPAKKAAAGECQNSCKGKSECKTAHNDCKGHNECKGKGMAVVAKDAAECKTKGGNWMAKKAH